MCSMFVLEYLDVRCSMLFVRCIWSFPCSINALVDVIELLLIVPLSLPCVIIMGIDPDYPLLTSHLHLKFKKKVNEYK